MRGIFGLQRSVAKVGVIEVVERGHAKDAFIESTQAQRTAAPRLITQKYCRSELAQVAHLATSLAVGIAQGSTVGDKRAQHACLCLESAPLISRSQRHQCRVAHRIGKAAQCGIESIPLIVGAQVDIPIAADGEFVCHRHINIVLPEAVVNVHQRGVGVEITHIVARILCIHQQRISLAERFLVAALGKEIAVPLALRVFPHIVHYGTGDAFLAVVIIELRIPLPAVNPAIHATLNAQRMQVAVAASGGGVPRQSAVAEHLAIAKLISTGGIGVFNTRRGTHAVVELMVDAHRGVHKPERAGAKRKVDVVGLAFVEARTPAAQIHRARRAKVARRLKNLALLTVIQRNLVDVVERKLAEVNLPVLRVAQLNAVVEHAQVVGAH